MPSNLRVLAAAVVAASTLTTLAGGAAQAATSSQAPVHRSSLSCGLPAAKANYSWADGRTSVTVYFNNHCSHKMSAKPHGVRLSRQDHMLGLFVRFA
ncbi:hypothetical protein [Nonomuraea angiospora]